MRKYIRFLIGAGNWRPHTAINLLVNGQVVRTAVGMGDREHLDWLQWNVSDLLNKTAQIQIVDSTTGGWGHINVDQIIATDLSLSSVIIPSKKYLLLPVKTGAAKRMVELVQEGLVVREVNVELSTTPDYWAFIELAPYPIGKELVVRLDSKLATSAELASFFVQGDAIATTTPIYQEMLRPIYHYSTKRGYLSDPNDLFYKDGVYHMSYQNNPVGWAWDNMTHCHAVSTDLMHWTEQPHTIVETYWGEAWNGSSVVDVNNTAGFGSGAIVTMWSGAAGGSNEPRLAAPNKFSQPLAYSTDGGYTYKEYNANPAVPWIAGWNHDPVMFWYQPGNHWVMVLFVEGTAGEYYIFNSTDLKNWVFTSSITLSGKGQSIKEVPDLYPLALDGNPNNVKWVFSAGYRQYIVGTFDGKAFTKEAGPFWFAQQKYDLSATLTFNHTPDGRRIMLSNGRTDYPGMPFNRYMNLPNVLTLKTVNGEPRVFVNPIAEVSNLRTSTTTWGSQTLNTGVNLMDGLSGEGVEMEIVFIPKSRSVMTFSVGEFSLTYDNIQGGKIIAGGVSRSVSPMADGKVHIRAFYDRGSWEIFANNGAFYMPFVLTPKAGTWPLTLKTSNASIDIVSLSLHKMGSIWSGVSGSASGRKAISETFNSSEEDNDGVLAVYPNPSTGHITIKVSQPSRIEILDMSGRPFYASHVEDRVTLERMTPGIYIVRMHNAMQTRTQKIVMQ